MHEMGMFVSPLSSPIPGRGVRREEGAQKKKKKKKKVRETEEVENYGMN